MESREVLMNGLISNGGVTIPYDNGSDLVNGANGLERVDGDDTRKVTLADEVLEDLEEYWEDINDRLMISRMVSDSVIKGMVTAVEQDAVEKIATKELELANLRQFLHSGEVGASEHEFLVGHEAHKGVNYRRFCSFTDACAGHDKMRADLHSLKNAAREQFDKTKKKVECGKGCNSVRKIGSGCELVGLSGILQEQQSESWLHVDEMLDRLETTVETVFRKVDGMLLSSKISLCGWQEEQDLTKEIEDTVIQTVFRSLHEQLEEKLWEQNARLIGSHNIDWIEKFNDLSSLRTQLDTIIKSLSVPEQGLVSHGSHDLDHLHHKAFGNHVTPTASLCEKNGALMSPNNHVPESYDFQTLKHMTGEELVNYFNNIITNIKRDHDSALQQITEKYFSLKREYLKEKDSFMAHRKDEEFDVLRKKIPEVIVKLDDFFSENERFPALANHAESLEKLNERLQNLLSENRQLRDCLSDKTDEVKNLEAQVSSSVGRFLEHSLAEQNMLMTIDDLKSAVEDSHIASYLNEKVCKCALRELIGQIRWNSDDSDMELFMTREVYGIFLREAATSACSTSTYGIEDSDIITLIMQGLNEVIFSEAVKDVEEKFDHLHQEVLIEREIRTCSEMKLFEKENELRLEAEEKVRLNQEIMVLGKAVEEKEKLVLDLSTSLSKQREQFEIISLDLTSVTERASQQQQLVAESRKEIVSLRTQLTRALDHIKVDELELHKLNENLDRTKEVLLKASQDRDMAFAFAQEMHDKLSFNQAREEKLKKEMEFARDNISRLTKMFDDFECNISRLIGKNNLRLQETNSHLKALTKTANMLRRSGLKYKVRLEQRCADLQMAEAEVDLLGDEVDALLRLLEKIYIGLDHYSPILKHYPGIIEILQLVRRELTGESTQQHHSSPWKDKLRKPLS